MSNNVVHGCVDVLKEHCGEDRFFEIFEEIEHDRDGFAQELRNHMHHVAKDLDESRYDAIIENNKERVNSLFREGDQSGQYMKLGKSHTAEEPAKMIKE